MKHWQRRPQPASKKQQTSSTNLQSISKSIMGAVPQASLSRAHMVTAYQKIIRNVD